MNSNALKVFDRTTQIGKNMDSLVPPPMDSNQDLNGDVMKETKGKWSKIFNGVNTLAKKGTNLDYVPHTIQDDVPITKLMSEEAHKMA